MSRHPILQRVVPVVDHQTFHRGCVCVCARGDSGVPLVSVGRKVVSCVPVHQGVPDLITADFTV